MVQGIVFLILSVLNLTHRLKFLNAPLGSAVTLTA